MSDSQESSAWFRGLGRNNDVIANLPGRRCSLDSRDVALVSDATMPGVMTGEFDKGWYCITLKSGFTYYFKPEDRERFEKVLGLSDSQESVPPRKIPMIGDQIEVIEVTGRREWILMEVIGVQNGIPCVGLGAHWRLDDEDWRWPEKKS